MLEQCDQSLYRYFARKYDKHRAVAKFIKKMLGKDLRSDNARR